ncbi:tol-pal system-associated acyl-CoA thioesterase [Gayadomonas joobiniege]|uniref:tol-pal system-associated acyl-CoA thioesterase n=1 Tax=Gayadomonas joobiniege TaxID=1234606 RepID=UPI00038283A4|nr:tol-pal system-associated acyl-CoA thioesterase [Gayadomonas joobiniege]
MTEFVFSFPVRVYYEDTDAGGIVYHANYLKFYERARTEFLSHFAVEQDSLLAANIGFVVRKMTIENKLAARFNDRLEVKTQIAYLKKASLMFKQWIEKDQQVINRAEVEIATVDLQKLKPVRIPDAIFGVLQSVI